MNKPVWYLIVLVIVVVAAISINELGYGIVSLLLLFPVCWLMLEMFGDDKPGN